ncbi:hypothetical protein MATL_G00227940 [Megalops atlanticus]|uniref:Anillin n=1 Tax=Megalops atlanticus TaxID=7932 RepID=A0A9D3PEI1_MEGAT|nr:hypothetical protein MATL_G00227940 [Megalops atlanticus]
MDPFTEKLLERTRARRENLQRKMAERPTPASRQMAKRTREPLTEANGPGELTAEKAPPSTKPSPSKRRCSSEKDRPVAGSENCEPPVAMAKDPVTDKKPPVAPASGRPTSSLERTAPRPVPERRDTPEPAPERGDVSGGDAGAEVSGMRSRLQRLAQQRQYWDSDAAPDGGLESPAPSPMKTQPQEVCPAPVSSEAPVGRRGRLANLAATIGSWEDDLSRSAPRRDNAQAQPGTACLPAPARETAGIGAKASATATRPQPGAASDSKPGSSVQQTFHSPVKSTRVAFPSPQKAELPEARPTPQAGRGVSASPLKTAAPPPSSPAALHSGRTFPASPQKAGLSKPELTRPGSQTSPRSPAPARQPDLGRDAHPSPKKPELLAKPAVPPASLSREATPLQRGPAHTPATGGAGVKSFLERFGERCQERSTQNSPSTTPGQRTPGVTPNTRLVQDRLKNTQVVTATADLTLKQKLEREKELAQIRSRFQRGNMWKSDRDPEEKELPQPPAESKTEDTVGTAGLESTGATITPSSMLEKEEFSLEKRTMEEEREKEERADAEVVREIEMNVDEVNSSEVINELFEGVLEESKEQSAGEEEGEEEEDEGEDGDEDALNISSMSLLTPLAETVAAVVRSPEMKLMTSTPASSFCEKSRTPDSNSRLSKFQRARIARAGASDGTEDAASADEDHNLPYSIDAYRSTRIKETERPHVQQVIVRKEDVSQKGEEPARPNHINIKQRMKILSNEMNLQQTVIHQASQALNCCTDEEHGKGTQVEAEAERLLLIATERRAALKAELDRLKGEGPPGQKKALASSKPQDDTGISASRGTVSLLELRLPLKADFVCAAANKPESSNYYFFIMIRAGAENTVATPLASTRNALSGDALTFSTKFTLPDVSNDFEIDVEVYCLVQKRELYSDKRKKPSKSKAITPKRLLTSITKSNLQTPVMASPGGPNAVRTSNFTLVGSHKLTLASIGKNKFPLEKINVEGTERQLLSDLFQYKVPFLCPLEGHVYLKLQCEVGSRLEERGFLTMFEDVSGFGAWHRRWCVLSGYCISYWTYPDDEKRKNPIGRINLANCTSRKVEPANREFCARPNTFELITVRPQREDDKETLVSRCKNTMCVTKNWLSADTKEERNLWMQKLNQILVDLRMWQPDSCYRPV